MNFKILENEGLKYSKISGDTNRIHIDRSEGYNSIFGEKICHGCLVILKTFKIINIKKIIKNYNKFSLKILFFKHFKYNSKIIIKKKNKNYELHQENQKIAEINIKFFNILKNKNLEKKCSIKTNKKFLNYYNKKNGLGNLSLILNNLTKYVGTVYPGKNSLISEININYNKFFNFNKIRTDIFSKKISKIFPIINNKLIHSNYIIEFQTLIRPKVIEKKVKPSKTIIKKIKNIKENVLIIGASQGIGRDVFNIFKYNKKILKIITYYKNPIKIKNKKIIKYKIDVSKDVKKINKIISDFSPIKIFYFATPKIFFDNKLSKKVKHQYKKIFIDIPLKIIKDNKNENMSFFYPSTTNIEYNNKSIYSKNKLHAENEIKNICLKNKIPFSIFRFPAINSRQSVSLLKSNLPSLIEFVNLNKSAFNKIFFTKSTK